MTNKEQREVWRKVFEENRKKIVKKECPSCSDLYHAWLAACEFMHENMSQSRYNFWKLTRIQKKKIDVLKDTVDFYAHDEMFKEVFRKHPNFGQLARETLQKIKELDESEGK